MIKPAKCAITGNETSVCGMGNNYWKFESEKTDGRGFYVEDIHDRTILGAILRWNWRQWRSRRNKTKKGGK